jgi:transposase-like protein
MGRKRHSESEIINLLRRVEVLSSQGKAMDLAIREIGVSEQTYYRWRKEYGGIGTEQVRKLKDLERENARLKRAVADLTLDNQILKEVASGNF